MSRRPAHQVNLPHQYDPYAPQLGYISESIHRLLTDRECSIFDRGLADYHKRRNVKSFVECLSLVLNSNHKRQLLIPVRDTYVKACDVSKFNQLVQTYGLATSLKRQRKKETAEVKKKKIEVKRNAEGDWGFNIRGGVEYGTGIYISWVEPSSHAYQSGLRLGDQILKANNVNFESISHYEAAETIKSHKKMQLWVLSHGVVPGSRMAHKVYHWVDPQGRPTTPPPDPFETIDRRGKGILTEADERRVTLIVEMGQELGISIRGGAEHGLGIYISAVERGSVAEVYGLKVGDQILEVNGISFLGVIHADAANSLQAQPTMVMKVKDVGKLPHSRITTYGQTQWYSSPQSPNHTITRGDQGHQESVFSQGAGTQVMHKKQERTVPGKGILWEVARSVLTSRELTTFTYYLKEYEKGAGTTVDDLVTPLLQLLDTPEKLQLLSEVRGIIRASDLDRFNELTVHKEIAARKAAKTTGHYSMEGSLSSLSRRHQEEGKVILTSYVMQPSQAPFPMDDNDALQLSPPAVADLSYGAEERTLTPGEGEREYPEDGGRDRFPQKLSPHHKGAVFHAPPPPSNVATSTPDGSHSPDPQRVLADTLKDRRRWMRPGAEPGDQTMDGEETWNGQWPDATLSSIQPHSPHSRPPQRREMDELAEIEDKIRKETEQKLRIEFEEKQRQLEQEQQRKLAEEKRQKEEEVRRQKEVIEQKLKDIEERARQELEAKIRHEAQEDLKEQLREQERKLAEQQARKIREGELKRQKIEKEYLEEQIREVEKRTKQELEEKIWREAEEHIRQEFEDKVQQETEQKAKQRELDEQMLREMEERVRRDAERKYRQEFDQKLQRENQKRKQQGEAERRRFEERERQLAQLEEREQERIELEERIRKETEEQVRAEYEAKGQRRKQQKEMEHKRVEERERQLAQLEEREQEIFELEDQETEEGFQAEYETKVQMETKKKGPPTKPKPKANAAKGRQVHGSEAVRGLHNTDGGQEEYTMTEQKRQDMMQAEEEARKNKMDERERKLELQRKREENIRKREEERKQKQRRRREGISDHSKRTIELEEKQEEEEEERQRQQEAEQKRQKEEQRRKVAEREQRRQAEDQKRKAAEQQKKEEEEQKQREEEERRQKEAEESARKEKIEARKRRSNERKAAFDVQHVKVKFEKEAEVVKSKSKTTQEVIQEERQKAEEELKKRMDRAKKGTHDVQNVKVGGEAEVVKRRPKTRQEVIDEERQKAEEKLKKRMDRAKMAAEVGKKHNVQIRQRGTAQSYDATVAEAAVEPEGKSFGGYDGLHGEIRTITVTKVCKRLGIAIDGGANTKQKAVIIREITEGGSAALSAEGLCVGMQILQVGDTSLYGLKHKEAVISIKNAFEGPLEKTMQLVVLDPSQ